MYLLAVLVVLLTLLPGKAKKKKTREIAFLPVLNFFPVQKLIFGHF